MVKLCVVLKLLTHKRLIPDSGWSVEVECGGWHGAETMGLMSSSNSSLRHTDKVIFHIKALGNIQIYSLRPNRTFYNMPALPGAWKLGLWVHSAPAGRPAAPAGWIEVCLTPHLGSPSPLLVLYQLIRSALKTHIQPLPSTAWTLIIKQVAENFPAQPKRGSNNNLVVLLVKFNDLLCLLEMIKGFLMSFDQRYCSGAVLIINKTEE